MGNTYFQFKHFIINQDRCAMKVTTDGCLFGAWAALWLLGHWGNTPLVEYNYNVLDIGSGTGLLGLMIAQKNPNPIIDAIEIDTGAAKQLQGNFNASPWKNNLNIYHSSIQDFVISSNTKYDLIISNPPFYELQLKGDNQLKNIAHHSLELTLHKLFSCVANLIKSDGFFIVLLPFYRTEEAIEIAKACNLFLQQKALIKQTPKHDYFRSILIFSRIKMEDIIDEEIAIKDLHNQYTPRFKQLLKDYYLQL